MLYVIFHGSFGSSEGNWFPDLKRSLEDLGQEVLTPQFPIEDWDDLTANGENSSPKKQNLENWLNYFEKEILPKLKDRSDICFIGHSIGPVFILHVLEKFRLEIDSAIFVCPFLQGRNGESIPWQYKSVNTTFYKTDFDFGQLTRQLKHSYALYSEDDPYVDINSAEDFSNKMRSQKIKFKVGGHLNADSGYTKFPLVLELCKTRIKKQ